MRPAIDTVIGFAKDWGRGLALMAVVAVPMTLAANGVIDYLSNLLDADIPSVTVPTMGGAIFLFQAIFRLKREANGDDVRWLGEDIVDKMPIIGSQN